LEHFYSIESSMAMAVVIPIYGYGSCEPGADSGLLVAPGVDGSCLISGAHGKSSVHDKNGAKWTAQGTKIACTDKDLDGVRSLGASTAKYDQQERR
jgi:hypothetical protein